MISVKRDVQVQHKLNIASGVTKHIKTFMK